MPNWVNIWFIVLIVIVLFCLYARKYANPYKLIMVFGKKGSGKSTLLTRLAIKYAKQGRIVYSNTPIYYPGIRLYNVEDIGKFTFPPYSIVMVEEVGMIWDNREFKSFRTDVRDWFKLQRHHKVTVFLFSQTFDIDVKLRNLTDLMYMCTNHFNVISIARRVNRKLVIVEPTGDSEGRIADGYLLQPLILQLFGMQSLYFTWIPKYKKYFKTDLIEDELPEIEYHEIILDQQKEDPVHEEKIDTDPHFVVHTLADDIYTVNDIESR